MQGTYGDAQADQEERLKALIKVERSKDLVNRCVRPLFLNA